MVKVTLYVQVDTSLIWCKCGANTNMIVKPRKSMQVSHTASGGHSHTNLPRVIEAFAVCDQKQGQWLETKGVYATPAPEKVYMICLEDEGGRRKNTRRNSLEWGEELYDCPDGSAPGPTALQRPSPRP